MCEEARWKHVTNDPLPITRGKRHELLGMTLYFGMTRNACTSSQYDFMKKLCMNFPESLKGTCHITPALEILLKVDLNTALVNRCYAEKCHEITAKKIMDKSKIKSWHTIINGVLLHHSKAANCSGLE